MRVMHGEGAGCGFLPWYLLREIFLRLDFPPCLVRAALVSRCWLRAASDPAFLRRFRDHHPPRLLGFVTEFERAVSRGVCFVPIPNQPPELAGAARRAAAAFHSHGGRDPDLVVDCRNGRLLVKPRHWRDTDTYAVRNPLCPARDKAVAPPLPPLDTTDPVTCYGQFALLPDSGGGDALSFFQIDSSTPCTVSYKLVGVNYMLDVPNLSARVYVLRAGAWVRHTSAPLELPDPMGFHEFPYSLTVGGNLYMVTMLRYIIGFDLTAASFFVVELPDGVVRENASCMDHRLGWAKNSGLCLVHVKGLELHIWLRSDDGGGNWELVDTVSQPEVFGDHFAKPFWDSVAAHQLNLMDEDDDGHLDLYSDEYSVGIHAVGDGAELVFLTVGKGVFYLDIKRRTAEKVLQMSVRQGYLCQIFPFMMPWPPIFPAPNEGHDKDE